MTGRTLHASAIAMGSRGLLILGPSGAGKSALALDLMSRGAALVADDRVALGAQDGVLIARCPPTLVGRIEARGVGILNAAPAGPTAVALVVDLGQAETDRLWNAIIDNGGQASVCGWCKDKWGLSWQITPRRLMELTTDPNPARAKAAMQAMMGMIKIDIAALDRAVADL